MHTTQQLVKISNDSRLELIYSIQVNGIATPSTIFLSYLPPKYSGTTLSIQKVSTGRYTLTHNLNIPINRQSVVCSACLEDSTIGVKSIYTNVNYIKLTFSDDVSANDTDFNLQFFKII